jgi:hypothetical protein
MFKSSVFDLPHPTYDQLEPTSPPRSGLARIARAITAIGRRNDELRRRTTDWGRLRQHLIERVDIEGI